jgi:hypothetical protein
MSMAMDKYKIIKKWSPVFESMGLANTKLREFFCLFAEDYQIRSDRGEVDNGNLPVVIRDLLDSVNKSVKIEVIRTLYNPLTGKLEYELEDGIIIDENNKFKSEPTIKDLISLFGVDFVREMDKQGFREEQINSIID